MDFKGILSAHKIKTCIISVERFENGEYGNIRIVEGNKAHYDDMVNTLHHPFVPDSPYDEYFPNNKNFEDFCYRSAFLGKPLHTYVKLPQMGLWLNMFLMPLESDKENIGYCMYSYDVTIEADSEQRASLSAETSAAVIQTCIKLREAGDVKEKFDAVIEDIRKICNSDHCCVLLTDDENKTGSIFCDSINPDSDRNEDGLFDEKEFYDIAKSWEDTIGDSTCVIIKDEHDMEWIKSINPLWHESLMKSRVRTVVLFPLIYNGERLGYMWALNFDVENTVKIKETLELTTFFIASEIFNYKLLNKLEEISSIDMLTGVLNRNTMNNDVDAIAAGEKAVSEPYAVLFVDINGLKRMNDEKGHSAGDNLLINSTKILCDAFPGSSIYRAGGDEFMILVSGIGEEEIKARMEKLREQSEKSEDVSFAIGMHMVNDGEDIRKAMRLADENMYSNKSVYYQKFPERKYR